jgi:predicted site-specific integrase-resolvase
MGIGVSFCLYSKIDKLPQFCFQHRDRFWWFGVEYIEGSLEAQSRSLVVLDPFQVGNDLVRDVTELLTSLCARLYGRSSAANKDQRAIDAVCS